jgi:hypothetical protein
MVRATKQQPKKNVRKAAPKNEKSVKSDKKSVKKPVSKQQKPKKDKKQEKPLQKRVLRVKEASIDIAGIGIGPARVKRVLTTIALNPEEANARSVLLAAENKPVMPKSTKANPNPQMPPQGPQTPLSKLTSITKLVNEAEESYRTSLVEEYERSRLKALLANNKKKVTPATYQLAKKEAQSKAGFVLRDFNKKMFNDFYDDLEKFIHENDNYRVGKTVEETDVKTGAKRTVERYNQWTRAVALINKLCVRLSSETRNILAGFLDNLVLQYAENGMFNCVNDKLSIVKLKHVLHKGEGFDTRVSLDAFARTLDSYSDALVWLADENPDKKYGASYCEEFDGYVVNICHSVRTRLANSTEDQELRMKYLNTSLSTEFKKFCSRIVYESILRVGYILRNVIDLNGVKTVSDNLMFHAIRQLHATVGLNSESLETDLRNRLEKFSKWRSVRKEKRKNNEETSNVDTDDDAN